MLQNVFNGYSAIKAIQSAYPRKYNDKAFASTNKKNVKLKKEVQRLSNLFKGKSEEFIKKHYTSRFLKEHKFITTLTQYNKSPYKLLNLAYPEAFHEWEFPVQKGYWETSSHRKKAIEWLIDQTDIDLSKKDFIQKGLSDLLEYYEGKTFLALCELYNIADIEKYTSEFLLMLQKCTTFGISHLSRKIGVNRVALNKWLYKSVVPKPQTLIVVYPELELYFKQYGNRNEIEVYEMVRQLEIKGFPIGFWNGKSGVKNARGIIAYLMEDTQELSLYHFVTQLNKNHFKKYKLDNMLLIVFENDFKKFEKEIFGLNFLSVENITVRKACVSHVIKTEAIDYPTTEHFNSYGLSELIKFMPVRELLIEYYEILNYSDLRENFLLYLKSNNYCQREFCEKYHLLRLSQLQNFAYQRNEANFSLPVAHKIHNFLKSQVKLTKQL